MLFRRNAATLALCLALIALLAAPAAHRAVADIVQTIPLSPGSREEAAAVTGSRSSSVIEGARSADAGGQWSYRFVVPPGSRLQLQLAVEGAPVVTAAATDGKPLPTRVEKQEGQWTVFASAPAGHPLGGSVRVQFAASAGPVSVRDVRLTIVQPDRNNNGISDAAEAMMGLTPAQSPQAIPRPAQPKSTFQTGLPYSPEIAVPADAVLVYSADAAIIHSWAERGYVVQTMGGFRENAAYARAHPDEVQKDASGSPLHIGGSSFYLIPTLARNEISAKYFSDALKAGSTAVAPEEPEIFASAGYSEAFKKEWQARYGAPWQPPHSSLEARWKAEQLKAFLARRQVERILDEAQKTKPAATRMLALHSPVNYAAWGITVPHASLLALPALQEVIGQVWTGTARTATRAAGVRMERTFETGFLEYSSLVNLTRGSGKRLWFLVDPVEDNPSLPVEDYQKNYALTVAAAMMFPQVDSFEVMPWPQRIFGTVPTSYATVVNTVSGVLSDLWRHADGVVDAGSAGIGTFVSDSMSWQRAEPSPSDIDGFFALTLPLVNHGVPVGVHSLDRVTEPGYIARERTLLLSYDYLKPASAAVNQALADWTRRGGSLVVVGGSDAYDALADSWWRQAGYASPLEELFVQMGLRLGPKRVIAPARPVASGSMKTVLTGTATERELKNRAQQTVDLAPFIDPEGSVAVRFEDVSPGDGWGPALVAAELRIGGRLAASFRAGSDLETRFLSEDRNSKFNSQARFADGADSWTYRFDNLPRDVPVTLTLDIGNGYLVKAAPAGPRGPQLETTEAGFGPTVRRIRVSTSTAVEPYQPPAGARTLYSAGGAPVIWETPVGTGRVIYVGVPPGSLSLTAQASRFVRDLVSRAHNAAGGMYQEKTALIARRGPYTAVRPLTRDVTLEGRFVNLLSPTLAEETDPAIPSHGYGLYAAFGNTGAAPRLAAVSGRLRARSDRAEATSFLVAAPTGTEGVARLYAGRKRLAGASAWTTLGQPVPVTVFPSGDTVLLRYGNHAGGVVVHARWSP